MAANNTIVLIGRLGADPEIKAAGAHQVSEINLAVQRPSKDSYGQQVTDWISCKFWNRQAEVLHQYVKKGDMISVSGSLQIDKWETVEGEKRSRPVISVDSFQMYGGSKAG